MLPNNSTPAEQLVVSIRLEIESSLIKEYYWILSGSLHQVKSQYTVLSRHFSFVILKASPSEHPEPPA